MGSYCVIMHFFSFISATMNYPEDDENQEKPLENLNLSLIQKIFYSFIL